MCKIVYLSDSGKLTAAVKKRYFEPATGIEVVPLSRFSGKSEWPDAWFFLNFNQESTFEEALCFIRGSDTCGLSPVLVAESSQMLPGIDAQVKNRADLIKKGKEITQSSRSLPPSSETLSPEQKSLTRFIRFLYTRKIGEVKPVPDSGSPLGFSYSPTGLFFGNSRTERDLLEEFALHNYFKKNLEEKVNLCPSCRTNNLSFREVCPKCSSPKVEQVSVIHHYRCGLMAPEVDFVTRKGYFCPKCHLKLIDIGTDYEIGSEASYCRVCKAIIPETGTRVKCLCLDCKKDNELKDLISVNIYSYKLTQYGIQVGIYGNFPSGISEYEDNVEGNYSWIAFQGIVLAELNRSQRYDRRVSLLKISLKSAKACRHCKRQDIWKIWKIMSDMARNLARTSDFVCQISPDLLYLLLPETEPAKARKFINRLKKEFIPPACRECKEGKLEISDEIVKEMETVLE
ncbi:MAG: hypothetical protein ACE5GM_03110 [bacterium]